MTNDKYGFIKYAPLSEDSGAHYRPDATTACGTATATDDFSLQVF
jgi:hypothetical protein